MKARQLSTTTPGKPYLDEQALNQIAAVRQGLGKYGANMALANTELDQNDITGTHTSIMPTGFAKVTKNSVALAG